MLPNDENIKLFSILGDFLMFKKSVSFVFMALVLSACQTTYDPGYGAQLMPNAAPNAPLTKFIKISKTYQGTAVQYDQEFGKPKVHKLDVFLGPKTFADDDFGVCGYSTATGSIQFQRAALQFNRSAILTIAAKPVTTLSYLPVYGDDEAQAPIKTACVKVSNLTLEQLENTKTWRVSYTRTESRQ